MQQLEVAKIVRLRGFLTGQDIKVSLVFLVAKTREAQDTGRISGSRISTEFPGHAVQESFRLMEAHSFHLPNDLEFPKMPRVLRFAILAVFRPPAGEANSGGKQKKAHRQSREA